MKELKKKNLPACFFITTESIGSNYIPAWDAECSIKTKWMNWKDVQSLYEEGFEIGAHTLNHVDLGIVKGIMLCVKYWDLKSVWRLSLKR